MTNIKNKIVVNSLSIYIAKAASLFISFFVFISIANYLGDVDFGKLSIAITYVAAFDIIANFGVNQIIIRELAAHRYKFEKVAASGITLKVIVTLSAFLLSLLSLKFINYPRETTIAIIIIAFNLLISSKLSSTRTIFDTVFQANLQMFYPMLFMVIDNVLFAVAFYLLKAYSNPTILQIALIYSITNLPGFLLIIIRFFRTVKPDFHGIAKLNKIIFIECIPVAFFLLFSMMTTKIDILMLSRMTSDADVGVYSAAVRLVYPLMFFSTSFTLSLFPLFSKYYGHDETRFLRVFYTGTKIVFLIAVILSIPLALNAELLVKKLYVAEFHGAVAPFRILIITLGFSFFNFYFIDLLIAVKKQKVLSYFLGVSLFFNILLNFLLIPKLSYVGSSYARLFSAILLFILFNIALIKIFKINKIFESHLLGFFLVFFLGQIILSKLNLILYFLLSTLFLLILILLFKIISTSELKLILNQLKRSTD